MIQPKYLLRLRQTSSKLEDMTEGTQFHRVLPETLAKDEDVQGVVFYSGKIYYELAQKREVTARTCTWQRARSTCSTAPARS